MWISRIDFAGFGRVSGEKIEFEKDKLNLVLESDAHGNDTISGAIWATIFNFPHVKKATPNEVSDKVRFGPPAGTDLPYIAGLDLVVDGRPVKIIREFTDEAVQIIDMAHDMIDITSDFMATNGEDESGIRLTGMSREVFRKLCFVGSGELMENKVGSLPDLMRVLKESLGGTYPLDPKAAVMALEEALAHFPHLGRKERGAAVVRDLEGYYYELSDKVRKLEVERKKAGRAIDKSGVLGDQGDQEEQKRTTEYFDLCSETSDIDSRLIKAQETLLRVQELRAELTGIGSMKGFPQDLQRTIEELWTRRQSRETDYDGLLAENGPKIRDFEEQERRIKEQYVGLEVFNPDDANALSVLAKQYLQVFEEIGNLHKRRREELEKIAEQNINLDELDEIRRSFSTLEPRDFDDAKTYNVVLAATKEQEKECERLARHDKMVLSEINEQRQSVARSSKNKLGVVSVIAFVLLVGLIALIVQHFDIWMLALTGVGLAVAAGFAINFALHAFRPEMWRLKEYTANQNNIEKQHKLGEELRVKASGLEMRIEGLAQKAHMADGAEFLLRLQDYTARAGIIRELDSLDQLIASCEKTMETIRSNVVSYFNRAGRTLDVSPNTTMDLADDLSRYIADSRTLANSIATINQARQQLEFLAAELKEADRQLQDSFVKAKLEHLHDIETGYREFYSKLAAFHRWQALSTELKRMETDMSSGFVPDELPPQIERLEKQRREKWKRIQQLTAMHAKIAGLGAPITPAPGLSTPATTNVPDNPKVYLDELKKERDELTTRVRSAATDDVSYQAMLKQLHTTQTELNIVRRVKNALEHAKERIYNAAPNEVWLNKLNSIVEDLLMDMGLELDTFDQQSHDEGEQDPARQMIGKPFSLKTVEQVRWFARIIVIKTLGLNSMFPLILNEPFGVRDEPLRPNNLTFLLELRQLGFQLIAITNNRSRYQSAFAAVSEPQQAFLQPCTRVILQA
jgi:division protein CdvB (Snf7/Vps24/ESCRT-III family)